MPAILALLCYSSVNNLGRFVSGGGLNEPDVTSVEKSK